MGKINFVKGQRPNPTNSFDGVYGDGGEVAEKIKSRLAKGSFELPMEMIVYVPSTKDGNIIIPKADFQARVKSVRTYLASRFGGFSSNPTDGGYMSNDNKGLIEEDVVKVTAFATKEALEESLDALLKKIQYWCKAWSQESIGFEFEGDLFYISATSKFMNGGMTENKIEKLYSKSEFINTDFTWQEKLLEMLQDNSFEAYEMYMSLSEKEKQSVLDALYYMDNDMGMEGDGNIETSKENLEIMLKSAKEGKKYSNGGTAEEQNRHMILSQAKEVAHHVEELNEILSKQPNIDSWVVAKMQDVTTGLSDITHYLDGKSEFRLGGENIQAVQDSMLTNGARLGKSKTVGIYKDRERGKDYYAIVDYLTDEHIETVRGLRSAKQYVRNEGMNLQEWEDWDEEDNEDDDYFAKGGNIKDLQKKLDNLESQRSSWIGGSESRAVKKTPYDDQIDEVFSQIQYLEKHGGDKFIFPKADELKSRYGGRDLEEKTATMFARLFSENVSYSKFVNSLQTPTQKEAFRKLQLSTYQNKWKVKPIISKSSDTLRFKKIFADGGQTFAADGAKLKSEMWWENAPQKVKEETIQYFANLKMMWNRKEITLSKSQIREIQNVQQIVAKKYPEYNRLFHSKAADGAKLKSGKLTLSKLKSMIEQYNAEGRNFELLGAYNQLELWSNDNRIETGSKEDIYKALIRYRYNPKYADGTELPEEIDFSNMTDEEIITFANTLSYYDRMDEGIEEEFTDVEDAKEYLRMMAE